MTVNRITRDQKSHVNEPTQKINKEFKRLVKIKFDSIDYYLTYTQKVKKYNNFEIAS